MNYRTDIIIVHNSCMHNIMYTCTCTRPTGIGIGFLVLRKIEVLALVLNNKNHVL